MNDTLLHLAERGWLPDALVRAGIRRLLRARVSEETEQAGEDFAEQLPRAPIALVPEQANAQHYEVPPEFFRAVLGPRWKYSCGYFPGPRASRVGSTATGSCSCTSSATARSHTRSRCATATTGWRATSSAAG